MNSSVRADVLCTKVRCFANTAKSLATSRLIFSTVLWSTSLLLAAINAPGSFLCRSPRGSPRCIHRRLRSTVFGVLSAKKVSGKGYISHAARFGDKEQRMGPNNNAHRAGAPFSCRARQQLAPTRSLRRCSDSFWLLRQPRPGGPAGIRARPTPDEVAVLTRPQYRSISTRGLLRMSASSKGGGDYASGPARRTGCCRRTTRRSADVC
jgi:hypothetical protein